MKEQYFLEADKNLSIFEFISDGKNGRFELTIQYSETNIRSIFNLGFGAINKVTGIIDDTIILNNGDTQKILRTVASSIYAFIDKYPNVAILIKGSTLARTRLYRMGITLNLAEIQSDFEVLGFKNSKWQPFNKNETYEAFLVNRKK
jgi:hypothetical protein